MILLLLIKKKIKAVIGILYILKGMCNCKYYYIDIHTCTVDHGQRQIYTTIITLHTMLFDSDIKLSYTNYVINNYIDYYKHGKLKVK